MSEPFAAAGQPVIRAAPRVLALAVPDLALQRGLRSRPGGGPLVLCEEGQVVQASAVARAAGVRPGDSLVQARAACAGLEALPLDRAADHKALQGLAEAMLVLAPAVEVGEEALLLDASAAAVGVSANAAGERRPSPFVASVESGRPLPQGEGCPSLESEARLAGRALEMARRLGYQANAAVADGKGPARALARSAAGGTLVVPPGETARAMAALPLEALELPAAALARLAAVGIRGVGALQALPPEALVHRFGLPGAEAVRLARGEDRRPLVPYLPEALPEEWWDCDAAVENAEPLLFGLRRLAERVAARLAGRGLGATRLRLRLALDPRGEERLFFPLARPSAAAAGWLLLLRERLGELRLGAPVTGLWLAAVEVAEAPPEQLAIGDRPEVARALEVVLSRLAARLGEAALFAAEPADRHRPEAAYRAVSFRPNGRNGARPSPSGRGHSDSAEATRGEGVCPTATPAATPAGIRPTRLLDPPRPVVAEGEGGRLTALRLDGRAFPVLCLAGPERLAGEWWSQRFDRDYYRVRLEGLGDAWVYRDGLDGRLYLHGLFD
ncbi:MAG TPA: DNA polymerase Y family protein [Anaeromyxobacteraceae bacterium]|nr:DNA polymerase Y family protein [Anaeromyxobacteraceae bacterium]